jgi:hypothetical protein
MKCGTSARLALFIDGLDEFDSPPLKVLELIQKINSRDGIKMCVASRHWTEFNDAFHESPMLRMQNLTSADMAHFVEAKLEGNRGFLELKRIFPTKATQLVTDVVTKAEGVFLWVSIVVRSLLTALTEGDGLSDLRTIVDQLPSDIALLYDAIWARIGGRNMVASAKLLTTFKAVQGTLNYITLWLADESQPLEYDIRTLSEEGMAGVWEIMKRRLDSRTRGILEISTSGHIDFLHRTASDWILQPRIWEGIRSVVPEDFDPYLQLLRAETIQMPQMYTTLSDLSSEDAMKHFRFHLEKVLWYASKVKQLPTADPELILILDKLDQEVDQRFRNASKGERGETSYARLIKQNYFDGTPFEPGLFPDTFLGLMATFCVLPYLRAKMPSDPNQKSSDRHASLLEYAVFGYAATSRFLYHIEWKQRIATVAFLLEHGVSRKAILSDGRPVIETVRKRRKETTDEDEKDYLIRVEELLSPKRSLKESLKTRFQRVKRR